MIFLKELIFLCTAVSLRKGLSFFGRNLDVEFSRGEQVIFMPRNFPFPFRQANAPGKPYAVMGIGVSAGGIPLFYDAINEKGLYVAALDFPESARYLPEKENALNLASFEFIPFLLQSCASLEEAKKFLEKVNITGEAFSDAMPPSPLHWFVADKTGAVAVEPRANGIRVYDNPVGVLTNEPPFEFHVNSLREMLLLSPEMPKGIFSEKLGLSPFGKGLGAKGLPGDASSTSRFSRAAFIKFSSLFEETEDSALSQLFHILGGVEQQNGILRGENSVLQRTEYTSCVSAEKGIYYYRTYENSRISSVSMQKENPDSSELSFFPLLREQDILFQN